jgi:hypothetical protein
LASKVRRAAILVPGGEVFVTPTGDTLEGTNTANRCLRAVELDIELRREGSYEEENIAFFTSGTADHPGQTDSTGSLARDFINRYAPGRWISIDQTAWDTGQDVIQFRRLLRHDGWWRKCDLYVVSEDHHTRRIQVLFLRRYGVVVKRCPTRDTLTPEQLRFERLLYALTCVPLSEYLLTWYAKRQRQTARAAADT